MIEAQKTPRKRWTWERLDAFLEVNQEKLHADLHDLRERIASMNEEGEKLDERLRSPKRLRIEEDLRGKRDILERSRIEEQMLSEKRRQRANVRRETEKWLADEFSTYFHTVPRWGEIVLLFVLPHKLRKTLPGDLEEEFRENVAKMGPRTARIWYWWQVIRSAGALVSYGFVAWVAHKFSR